MDVAAQESKHVDVLSELDVNNYKVSISSILYLSTGFAAELI